MNFFFPYAESTSQAEQVYDAFAKFVKASNNDKRIWKLAWNNDNRELKCEVGRPLQDSYITGNEPVLAIFSCKNSFKIVTPNRGGITGEPVSVEKYNRYSVTYFEPGS